MSNSPKATRRGLVRSANLRKRTYHLRNHARFFLYQVVHFCLRFLTAPALLVRLKQEINPLARLDYAPADIYLHADSTVTLRRAKACGKEPSTVEWLESHLRDGDVLYDVGANVGAYSLVAAKQTGKKVVVYSFEPSFSTYQQLCRNIILNDCQNSVVAYMNPLSGQTGHTTFHYHSVEAGTALHALGKNVDQSGNTFQPVYIQSVISFSLDNLVEQFDFPVPHLVKLDVDGIELGILHGAQKTLDDRRVRSLLVEIADDAPQGQATSIVKFLTERGFRLEKKSLDRTMVKNFIFERANSEYSP